MTRYYYWFEPAGGRLGYGDNRKPIKGRTHKVRCEPALCCEGLHASRHPHDALNYAKSGYLWRVQLGGTVVHGDDKSCATERTYIARIDANDLLWRHARLCALDVIDLWDAPDVVRDYLRTGDKTKRDAARAAALDAARAAALDAALDNAAWAASRAAARDAARAALRAAAWDAARAATRRRFGRLVNEAFREASA